MISFWEQSALLKSDIAIVGGGITGLLTALEVRKKLGPTPDIVVLERSHLPLGASTRNAGFACIGSLTEIMADWHREGENAVGELLLMRHQGLNKLRSIAGDSAIDYVHCGGYEVLDNDHSLQDEIDRANALAHQVLGKTLFSQVKESPAGLGLNSEAVSALVFNREEGMLHSGKLMKRLQELCHQSNITLRSGFELSSWQTVSGGVLATGRNAFDGTPLTYRLKTMVLCTNAFTAKLLPELDIVPGRGIVGVTAPIPGLKLQGTFHYDEGFYYFRNIDHRLLFGGGRNLDFETEETFSMDINPAIANRLGQLARKLVMGLPEGDVFEYLWAGTMAFGNEKRPLLLRKETGVYVAARMGGMGVAIASVVAEKMAEMVAADLD